MLYYQSITGHFQDDSGVNKSDSYFECHGSSAMSFLHIGELSPSVAMFNDLFGRTEKSFTIVFVKDAQSGSFCLIKTAFHSSKKGIVKHIPLLAGKLGDAEGLAKSAQEFNAVELSVKAFHDIFSKVMQVTCAVNSEYRILKDPMSGFLFKASHLYNISIADSEITPETTDAISDIGKVVQTIYPTVKHILELK